MLKERIHRYIFLLAIGLCLVSLPFSRFTLTLSLILLTANWLIEGSWLYWKNIKSTPAILIFLLIYLALIFGLFYSDNIDYALADLRLKLPLLIVPLIFATSPPLSSEERQYIISLFCFSVFVATAISFVIYVQNFSLGSSNVREISPFISHIRYAIMISIAIALLLWYAMKEKRKFVAGAYVVLALWLIFFIFVLQSLTGMVLLMFVAWVFAVALVLRINIKYLKWSFILLIVILSFFPPFYIYSKTIDYFSNREDVAVDTLPKYTVNGNKYAHHKNPKQYENGNLVWINVCWEELEQEWNRRSKLTFDGNDRLSQPLYSTLIRYMTSKGFKKDSAGVWKLDTTDIRLIEDGVTSVVYKDHKLGVYPRLYQVLWEVDQYLSFGKVSGSSVVQRIVFIDIAIGIIKNNFWFGVGTGDLNDAFTSYYRTNDVNISEDFWYLSHNQFLTHWVQVGFLGLLLFAFGWFLPIYLLRKKLDFITIIVFGILTLSMLNEDTFQTHIGVSMVGLFYGIFVFGSSKPNVKSEDWYAPKN
ncbi:MAG: O-antigen ligase family protein [Bacteroidales bacterium]